MNYPSRESVVVFNELSDRVNSFEDCSCAFFSNVNERICKLRALRNMRMIDELRRQANELIELIDRKKSEYYHTRNADASVMELMHFMDALIVEVAKIRDVTKCTIRERLASLTITH